MLELFSSEKHPLPPFTRRAGPWHHRRRRSCHISNLIRRLDLVTLQLFVAVHEEGTLT